jgi:hypothetical protein
VADAAHRLSNVETEQLRDLRARLNRVPKGVLGDKSVGPFSKGFFDLCVRLGLSAPAGPALSIVELTARVAEADIAELAAIVGALQSLRQADAKTWRAIFDAGLLQAILTRRLVLGDRERL